MLLLVSHVKNLVLAAHSNINHNSIKTDTQSIQHYLQTHDMESLFQALDRRFRESERNLNPLLRNEPLSKRKIQRGGGLSYTSQYKLKADLEQAQYLASSNDVELSLEVKELLQEKIIPIYENVLKRIPPLEDLVHGGLYQFQEADLALGIDKYYNRAIHVTSTNSGNEDAQTCTAGLLNPELNITKIQEDWLKGGLDYGETEGGIVVLDDVLSKEAFRKIRKILLESTVFYQTKLPKQFGGYAGAYLDDGLHDRLLLELSQELRNALPTIFKEHALKYLWAYKYDSNYDGINLHADEAAVNVNIWLTPDDANLDPHTGGLVIFSKKPPADWSLGQYNGNTSFVRKELLEPTGFANVTVPFRANRAVIFDSALFHQSDTFHFRKGYENRRINLTILYGNMQRLE